MNEPLTLDHKPFQPKYKGTSFHSQVYEYSKGESTMAFLPESKSLLSISGIFTLGKKQSVLFCVDQCHQSTDGLYIRQNLTTWLLYSRTMPILLDIKTVYAGNCMTNNIYYYLNFFFSFSKPVLNNHNIESLEICLGQTVNRNNVE